MGRKDVGHGEGNFGSDGIKEFLQNHMCNYLCYLLGLKDEDIVYVGDNAGVIKITEDPVHHTHERGWCVTQPERQYSVLEVTVARPRSRLVLVFRPDQDVVEAIS